MRYGWKPGASDRERSNREHGKWVSRPHGYRARDTRSRDRRSWVTIEVPDCLVVVTAPVTKMCPVKNEVDEGTVTISYQTHGKAIELHDLAAYLATFSDRHISHEEFVHLVARETGAEVSSIWATAGMSVEVKNSP